MSLLVLLGVFHSKFVKKGVLSELCHSFREIWTVNNHVSILERLVYVQARKLNLRRVGSPRWSKSIWFFEQQKQGEIATFSYLLMSWNGWSRAAEFQLSWTFLRFSKNIFELLCGLELVFAGNCLMKISKFSEFHCFTVFTTGYNLTSLLMNFFSVQDGKSPSYGVWRIQNDL